MEGLSSGETPEVYTPRPSRPNLRVNRVGLRTARAFCQGIKQIGSGISIYHDTKFRDKDIPVEAAISIPEKIASNNKEVWVYELPEVETMATVIHQGSFSSLGEAYNALLAWIEKHHYQIVGSTREIYLQYERDGDESQYVTEVQIPVEKV